MSSRKSHLSAKLPVFWWCWLAGIAETVVQSFVDNHIIPFHQSLPAAEASGQPCKSDADTELLRQACTSGACSKLPALFIRCGALQLGKSQQNHACCIPAHSCTSRHALQVGTTEGHQLEHQACSIWRHERRRSSCRHGAV